MKLSDAEWAVMGVVWRRDAASAREVLEEIAADTGWAYTTVKTLLGRLVEKGAVSEHKRGNTSIYEPLITRKQARAEAVRSLLDRAFDGAFGSLMQHLIKDEKLSKRDRARLAAMLEGEGAKKGRKR